MLTRISLGLAAACLAACTNMSGSNPLEVLGRKINLGLATEVPFLVPARSAEAAALRSLTIVSSGQPLTQEVGSEVEALLLQLKIQEKDYYEKLKHGDPIPVAQLSENNLDEMGRRHATAGVVGLSRARTGSSVSTSREERTVCATNKTGKCPKDQLVQRTVSCRTTQASASVHTRVFRMADRKTIFVDTLTANTSQHVCDGDNDTENLTAQQLESQAAGQLAKLVAQAVAPSFELRPLDLKAADAKVPPDRLADFNAALNFAKAKRLDEACTRFGELYDDIKESVALTYNMGFCEESRGDLLRAAQSYRRASELNGGPDLAIDDRLREVEQQLRKSPAGALPVMNGGSTLTNIAAKPTGKRVALVIGNARYEVKALTNPVNDAQLMTNKLKRMGFDVTHAENVNGARLGSLVNDFSSRSKRADIALFFYAGHAIQADGDNLLMPVDNKKMQSIEDVREQGGLPLGLLLAKLDAAGARARLVILDACRNNPLPATSRAIGAGDGLSALPKPASGSLIAFSTEPGRTAEDGVGKNSLFTKALANVITTPGLPVEQVFKRVREDVIRESNNKQRPTEANSLAGDLILVPAK